MLVPWLFDAEFAVGAVQDLRLDPVQSRPGFTNDVLPSLYSLVQALRRWVQGRARQDVRRVKAVAVSWIHETIRGGRVEDLHIRIVVFCSVPEAGEDGRLDSVLRSVRRRRLLTLVLVQDRMAHEVLE